MAVCWHDKVEDIECLVGDPSRGDGPSGENRANGRRAKENVRKWRDRRA